MPILLKTQVESADKTPVTACRARVSGLCGFRGAAERVPADTGATGWDWRFGCAFNRCFQ